MSYSNHITKNAFAAIGFLLITYPYWGLAYKALTEGFYLLPSDVPFLLGALLVILFSVVSIGFYFFLILCCYRLGDHLTS